jgi:hypothetical protein
MYACGAGALDVAGLKLRGRGLGAWGTAGGGYAGGAGWVAEETASAVAISPQTRRDQLIG